MWTATWDQNKAPWLQLGSTSGQIQAPDTQTITVSALASRLKAGTYTTLVTFGNTPSNQAIMLNITLTVQAGCITATPKALNFTGIANTSDPAPQTVTLNNCGLTGTWSGSATTGTGGNWLSVQPTSGSIDGGKTQTVNITASNLSTRLSAGAYRGNLLFVDGSSEINIPVTFIVQSLPILTVNLTSIDANRDCSLVTASEWSCTEILTNNPGTQTSLNWTASSGGNKSIVFRQSSGTIAPGQTVSVVFLVSTAACQAPITLIFTGPANTVNVPLTCTPLIA